MAWTSSFEIERLENAQRRVVSDLVVCEELLVLEIAGGPKIEFHCSPGDLEFLISGYLASEGFIEGEEEIISLELEEGRALVRLTHKSGGSGRSLPVLAPCFALTSGEIFRNLQLFEEKSALFKKTGGVHGAALHSEGKRVFQEDLGRYNAFDKAVGRAFLEKWDFKECFAFTSGRVGTILVEKAVRLGLPVLISKAAPTAEAVQAAREANLTLCGFARGKRLNIYSGGERIL